MTIKLLGSRQGMNASENSIFESLSHRIGIYFFIFWLSDCFFSMRYFLKMYTIFLNSKVFFVIFFLLVIKELNPDLLYILRGHFK